MTNRPDDLPPEWLAAYVDGELTPRERARVENWLADNPEAREIVESQESFTPANAEYWRSVQPPAPSASQWNNSLRKIGEANPPRPHRPWTKWISAVGFLATAASIATAVVVLDRPIVESTSHEPAANWTNSVAEAPIEMATAEDVKIISLPESAANMLVVGEHPLHGIGMNMARFGEVEFLGIGSDLAGKFPQVPTDSASEEIPMIWAPRAP